ncbi:hypothetical protein chiPu_0024064, partial [Chiloscyllium punctatum]|nr:hypothetical protein [Chiloscyllium punctatum]
RRIIQLKLLKGPDKILLTLNDVTFINPQLSKKKISGEDSQLNVVYTIIMYSNKEIDINMVAMKSSMMVEKGVRDAGLKIKKSHMGLVLILEWRDTCLVRQCPIGKSSSSN